MTAMDFPPSPNDGDTHDNYVYDATHGVWNVVPEITNIDLNNINDVSTISPQDGDIMIYDANSGEWTNSPQEVSLGLVIALG